MRADKPWPWHGCARRESGLVDTSWSIGALGDFNVLGKADILWHNANAQISIWESTGSGFSSVYTGSAPTNWAAFAMHHDIV